MIHQKPFNHFIHFFCCYYFDKRNCGYNPTLIFFTVELNIKIQIYVVHCLNCIEPSANAPAQTNMETNTTTSTVAIQSKHNFLAGELIWGPVRGYNAWPGKVISPPSDEASSTTDDDPPTCWVQWFGRRATTALMRCSSLKSLSEGLDAHHRAQRNSRK